MSGQSGKKGRIAEWKALKRTPLLTDQQNTLRNTASNGGVVVHNETYEPFGEPTSTAIIRYRYTGRESKLYRYVGNAPCNASDPTGLEYNRARHFDPTPGVFLNEGIE